MALNMPQEMYQLIKPIYGTANVIKIPIQSRFYNQKRENYEYIYYWKK